MVCDPIGSIRRPAVNGQKRPSALDCYKVASRASNITSATSPIGAQRPSHSGFIAWLMAPTRWILLFHLPSRTKGSLSYTLRSMQSSLCSARQLSWNTSSTSCRRSRFQRLGRFHRKAVCLLVPMGTGSVVCLHS